VNQRSPLVVPPPILALIDFGGVVTDVAVTNATDYLYLSETNRRSPFAHRIWNQLFGLVDIFATQNAAPPRPATKLVRSKRSLPFHTQSYVSGDADIFVWSIFRGSILVLSDSTSPLLRPH
jgi:hypothetical protein